MDMPLPVKFVLAFVVVLALIAIAAWAYRRFAGARLGTPATRGRQPRLAVIDAASLGDGRRKLVLIRRDNVEHLVLIGGPSDIVVEQNIVRAVPVAPPREAAREAPPREAGREAARDAAPREAAWVPEPPVRPTRQPERQPERLPEANWAPEPVTRAPRQPERLPEPDWGQPEPVARAPRQPERAPEPQPDAGWAPPPEPVA